MAQINVAILGAGRIAQSMAETLVKMAADDRYRDLVAPYAVAARRRRARSGVRGENTVSGVVRIV